MSKRNKKQNKKTNILAIVAILMIVLMAACDSNSCPEGSMPILDQNGDLIDCTHPFDTIEASEVQQEEQLKDSML